MHAEDTEEFVRALLCSCGIWKSQLYNNGMIFARRYQIL